MPWKRRFFFYFTTQPLFLSDRIYANVFLLRFRSDSWQSCCNPSHRGPPSNCTYLLPAARFWASLSRPRVDDSTYFFFNTLLPNVGRYPNSFENAIWGVGKFNCVVCINHRMQALRGRIDKLDSVELKRYRSYIFFKLIFDKTRDLKFKIFNSKDSNFQSKISLLYKKIYFLCLNIFYIFLIFQKEKARYNRKKFCNYNAKINRTNLT